MSILHRFLLVCAILMFPCLAAGQTENDDVIKVETNLVTLPVIVSDRDNRYISRLTQKDFTLRMDGAPQPIGYFAADEAPLNVAILLDTSRSTEPVLDQIKKAAREFIKQLKPADRAMVVAFDAQVRVLAPLTNDRNVLNRAIKNADIGDNFGTLLNDAIRETLTTGLSGFQGRKAIILLTDGVDAGSSIRNSELLFTVAESDALIYPIFYETRSLNAGRFGNRGRFPGNMPDRRRRRIERTNERATAFLKEIAARSAGRFFDEDIEELAKTFTLIADELRNQYVVGFYADGLKAGQDYRIRVEVSRPNAVVRTKTSFRAR